MSALRFGLLGIGSVALLVTAGVMFSGPADPSEKSATPPPPPERSWTGIDTTQYRRIEGEVQRSDTFADVLQRHGISYADAIGISRAARPVFDVRDLRAGQPYHVYVNPWLQEAQYLVYQRRPEEHVVFDLQDPGRTRIARRSPQRRWVQASVRIEGSLYESLTDQGVHPMMVLRLSEVFAWQIDFFRLRAGDSLRVVYERRHLGGERIAPGPIVAAYFKHQGERYYGFRFDNGDGPDYFDRRGQSLRRSLLKAPLRYTRISSSFSNSRYHPILKEHRPHHGTDYAAPRGTPVRAVGDGTVQFAGYDGPNGNYVKIRHNGTYTTGYLHLSRIADGIRPGATVKQEETIGYVGSTGRSTGPHLDYRLWKRGRAVDPYDLELPPSEPVQPQHRGAFRRRVEMLTDRLHQSPLAGQTSALTPAS